MLQSSSVGSVVEFANAEEMWDSKSLVQEDRLEKMAASGLFMGFPGGASGKVP